MALTPGSTLGPYSIVALIGQGGMGEVYRARDSRLQRDVALKVLPELFAADPDRLARFRREAQVLASLNHPNIAAIHGFEEASVVGAGFSRPVQALVLELVEGPTLADRIAQGPLPLDEALPIARQIAEAIEAAHEHGVIHRDLKPANIKLRPDGTVKVLDFGLAKAFEPEVAGAGFSRLDVTASPTITSPAATRVGMILGTAAYMSPEQARGKPVDKRTDVWAFGCVLYEMLTGMRAFGGDEITDTLAFIITRDIDWTALPAATPPQIRTLLRRCLEKDRRERLGDISVARLEIRDALAAPPATAVPANGAQRRRWIAPALAALLGMATMALGTIAYLQRATPEPQAYRASITLPEGLRFGGTPISRFALSPDGRRLAFVATDDGGRQMLWIRPLDAMVAQPLIGTEGANYPCWSADSRSLAFRADGKLKRVDASGGPPLTLMDAPAGASCAWNEEDIILTRPVVNAPLHRIGASGGMSVPATTLDPDAGDVEHTFPAFLPDSSHFLYTAIGIKEGAPNQPRGIYVGSLEPGETSTLIVEGGSNVSYAEGHLLFLRDNVLLAQAFDPESRQLRGEPIPIASDVARDGSTGAGGAFFVSNTGVVVYEAGAGGILSELQWLDRSGKRLGVLGEREDLSSLALSPDGTRAAVSIVDNVRGTRDLWIYDVTRGLRTRLTFEPGDDGQSVWSPDGSRILFSGRRKGPYDLVQKLSNGTGSEEQLLSTAENKVATDISPDGQHFLYSTGVGGTNDLWVLPLFGDRKPLPLVAAPGDQYGGRFSPDGRWVAYTSRESGRNEVYVIPFPGAAGKWQVSASGAHAPRWRGDGRELYYLALDNRVMAAAVTATESLFEVGTVRPLFATQARLDGPLSVYDVTKDGQRFLVNHNIADLAPSSVTLLVNWPALLKQ